MIERIFADIKDTIVYLWDGLVTAFPTVWWAITLCIGGVLLLYVIVF